MSLFEPEAIEAIFQATGGLPRRVNLLCHHALTAAAVARQKTVTAAHVEAAVPEVS
jgi:type II secretory pathway predicted ATPase ExeA